MDRELITNTNELNIEKEQNNFLETTLGKTINTAVDIGIRALLPNYLEDAIINIKDTLLTEGLTEGIKTIVENGINVGKSLTGIFTGKFENVSQMQNAVEKGGLIDATSTLLDSVLNKVQKKQILPREVTNVIKKGKNIILDNVSKNIENTLTAQTKEIEKINTYTQNWEKYYNEKDFNKMDKEYKKLQKSLDKVMPIESTIKKAREIENLHNRIKNNGKNFEINKEEEELAKLLIN